MVQLIYQSSLDPLKTRRLMIKGTGDSGDYQMLFSSRCSDGSIKDEVLLDLVMKCTERSGEYESK